MPVPLQAPNTSTTGAASPSPDPRADASGWRDGARQSVPIALAVAPIGLVFGALAAATGLTTFDAMLMSGLVYAGASQMVAVDLFGRDVPFIAIAVSVLAVNFRHVLYSAALAPVLRPWSWGAKAMSFGLLVDPQFALSERRRDEGRAVTPAWYAGLGLPIYACWLLTTLIGSLFGARIEEPAAFALDMIFPIYFLALVMGFRARPNWTGTVLTAGVVALMVYHAPRFGLESLFGLPLGSPWHVTLGAAAGLAVAGLKRPAPRHDA